MRISITVRVEEDSYKAYEVNDLTVEEEEELVGAIDRSVAPPFPVRSV